MFTGITVRVELTHPKEAVFSGSALSSALKQPIILYVYVGTKGVRSQGRCQHGGGRLGGQVLGSMVYGRAHCCTMSVCLSVCMQCRCHIIQEFWSEGLNSALE